MSTSDTSAFNAAVDAAKWSLVMFFRCWSPIMFGLGIVGHSMSIFVFTRPALLSNPCGRYFLASSISGFCVTCSILPLRGLQFGYNINAFSSSLVACKMLSYCLTVIRVLPSWFILLACADRFFSSSSSVVHRRCSSLHIASRAIPIVVLFISLIYIHVIIYFTFDQTSNLCAGQAGLYQTFFGFCHLVIWGCIPPFGMFVFSFLTIRNVRQKKARVAPQNIEDPLQQRRRKTERQMIHMALVQSLVFCLTTVASSVEIIYDSLTIYLVNDALQRANYSLRANVLATIAITGPCTSFYLFTLSSQLFRDELMRLFRWRPGTRIVTITNQPLAIIRR